VAALPTTPLGGTDRRRRDEALIRCAKAAAWKAAAPSLHGLPAPETLLETARAQHALAIVGRALCDLPDCPPALQAELQRIDRGAWATHVMTAAALGPVLAEAAAEGMRLVVYKGAALAARHYDHPWTRAMTDVDVLVPPAEEPRLHALLARRGWTPLATPAGRVWSVKVSHEHTFAPSAAHQGARLLDVHTAPAQPARYRFPVREMLDRAEPGTLFEAPVHFLAAADELLVMAANQAHDHYRFGLLRYLDVWLITKRAEVDWDALIATARAAGVQCAAWLTLSNARRIAGAVVPATTLDRLRPSAARRLWLRAALDLDGRGEPRRAFPRRLEQLLLLYPTLDRPAGFVRFGAIHGSLRALDAAAALRARLSHQGSEATTPAGVTGPSPVSRGPR
jgi:hypothetical protein